jgi:hypothetical protein
LHSIPIRRIADRLTHVLEEQTRAGRDIGMRAGMFEFGVDPVARALLRD